MNINSGLKLSNYNFFLHMEDEERYLVYNSLSNGLGLLEPDVYSMLNRGEEGLSALIGDPKRAELIENLKKGSIIVDKEFNELDFLKTRYHMSKFGPTTLALTIVTTLSCNLLCIYCYQGELAGKVANNSTLDAVLEFTKERIERAGYKNLHITWYGGEPLLNKDYLFSLSSRLINFCKKKKIGYAATIVTNGTVLNKEIVKRLKRHQVRHMQITIDGPKHIHDQRRPLKAGGKSSYDVIMKNIGRVKGILPVQIRINVDKSNYDDVFLFLDDLDGRGWLSSGDLAFYIGYTREWTSNCSNIVSECFSMKEFSQAEIDFQKRLLDRGYDISNIYPTPSGGACFSLSPHGYVIDPGGELHKCWADVGNKDAYLGNVRTPIAMSPKLLKWLSFNPFEKFPECTECKFFPICGGGCPYVAIKQMEKLETDRNYNCTAWKLYFEEKMRIFLQAKADNIKKEN